MVKRNGPNVSLCETLIAVYAENVDGWSGDRYNGSLCEPRGMMIVPGQKMACAGNVKRMGEVRDASIFVWKTKGHTGVC
jgi:hypothetical protein